MKKNMNGKMNAVELDMIVGGVGYCYWQKEGNTYNYVCADRPLSRDEVIQIWNHKGLVPLLLPARTDEKGNVLPQTQNISLGRGLREEYVGKFMHDNNQRYGGCHYIEFK